MARSHRERPEGAFLSHSRFLNRQNLYLRPDPARVVVRPFKPATEPRDLNPTDKSRANHIVDRSEEHTSELQSHVNLVCRLLLEKKKKKKQTHKIKRTKNAIDKS